MTTEGAKVFCKSNPIPYSYILVFLYTCIPVYFYPVHPVNPVKKIFLRNEANLQKAGSRQLEAFLRNEPNFNVGQASVLEYKSVSISDGFLNFDFCLLI